MRGRLTKAVYFMKLLRRFRASVAGDCPPRVAFSGGWFRAYRTVDSSIRLENLVLALPVSGRVHAATEMALQVVILRRHKKRCRHTPVAGVEGRMVRFR